MSERSLAVELDRALAGAPAGHEARELAALLVAAAEPSAFDVTGFEVDAGLARATPAGRARHALLRPLRIGVVVAVAVFFSALPSGAQL